MLPQHFPLAYKCDTLLGDCQPLRSQAVQWPQWSAAHLWFRPFHPGQAPAGENVAGVFAMSSFNFACAYFFWQIGLTLLTIHFGGKKNNLCAMARCRHRIFNFTCDSCFGPLLHVGIRCCNEKSQGVATLLENIVSHTEPVGSRSLLETHVCLQVAGWLVSPSQTARAAASLLV